MDMLLNWMHEKGDVASVYSFCASAVIKDQEEKIIGVRFEWAACRTYVDVPIITLMEAFNIPSEPTDYEDLLIRFLNRENFINKPLSPWNDIVCTINLRGVGQTELLPTIHFKEGFTPVDEEPYYTTFICPKMVFRFYDLDLKTLSNLRQINSLIYNTEFVEIFGISEVEQLSFYNSGFLNVVFRTYKGRDMEFVSNFKKISDAFCGYYNIPIKSIQLYNSSIIIKLSNTFPYIFKIPEIKMPIFDYVEETDECCNGFVNELGFEDVFYVLPNKKYRKLLGIGEYFLKKDIDIKSKKSPYWKEIVVNSVENSRGVFKRYVRINKNTFIVLLGTAPHADLETVDSAVREMNNGVLCSENKKLFEECLAEIHDSRITIKNKTFTTRVITIEREVDIDEEAFGEANVTTLKDIIAKNFIDVMNNGGKIAYCKKDKNKLKFSLEIPEIY